MTPDDLAAELPPPRDDEPASLRQDIIDELSDHLQCALHRELLAHGSSASSSAASGGRQSPDAPDEHSALQVVLARFGNPAALARRLWFDAMKEKLMAQRITVVMATITALLGLVACGLLWQFVTDSRSAQQALVEAQQRASAELIDKLTMALASRGGEASPSEEWIALKVRLIDEAGAPAAGTVQLNGKPFGNDSDAITVSASVDAEGVTKLQSVPAGKYWLSVHLANPPMRHSRELVLGPGRPPELTITCPAPPTETYTLNVDIPLPPDLAELPLYFKAAVMPADRFIDGDEWDMGQHPPVLLLNRRGNILGSIRTSEEVRTNVKHASRAGGEIENSHRYTLGDVPALPVLPTEIQIRALLPRDATWTDLDAVPPLLQIASAREFDVERFDPPVAGTQTVKLTAEDRFWSVVREQLDDVHTYYSHEIQLVSGTENGPPARGFDVAMRISHFPDRGSNSFKYFITPGDAGAVLSVSKSGTYNVVITAPWSERAIVPVPVGPNVQSEPTRIVCPAGEESVPAMPVKVHVKEPADVAGRGLLYVVSLRPNTRSLQEGITWVPQKSPTHPIAGTRNPNDQSLGDVVLIVSADDWNNQSVHQVLSHSVSGSDMFLQTVELGEPAHWRSANYYASIPWVLMPLSAESLDDMQVQVDQPLDFIGVKLNLTTLKFDSAVVSTRTDEEVTLEIDASEVRLADALEQWEHRMSQQVVTVPVDFSHLKVVAEEVGKILKPKQMIELTLSYSETNPNDERHVRTVAHHLAFAMLVTLPKRQPGQLEPTVPVRLLVHQDDVEIVALAAERALLQVHAQSGLTAAPSKPVINRDQLRETLLKLPEDPDKAELIRQHRQNAGGGFF